MRDPVSGFLFFVLILILPKGATSDSCPLQSGERFCNTNGLSRSGSNVCTFSMTRTETYTYTTYTIEYYSSSTSCWNIWSWFSCSVTRSRSSAMHRIGTRTLNGVGLRCCTGWRQSGDQCTIPICTQGCGHGSCTSPGTCMCDQGWTRIDCSKDIDECAHNNGGCEQGCTNFNGGYSCYCWSGYRRHSSTTGQCININECNNNPCTCYHLHKDCATCVDTIGSFRCRCLTGYSRISSTYCKDTNECLLNNGGCSHLCNNQIGSYSCACPSGLRMSDNITCADIDECAQNNAMCQYNCTNTYGSYACSCPDGHSLDGNGKTCSEINCCETSDNRCQETCSSISGVCYCSCSTPGHGLNTDQLTCSDMDECQLNISGCTHQCHNTDGSFQCSCYQGYHLVDSTICKDDDECALKTDLCEHICYNNLGSYSCGCQHGYRLHTDSQSCIPLPCESIEKPANGIMNCTGHVTGSNCVFTCYPGYDLVGSNERRCMSNSLWNGTQASCTVKKCDVLQPPNNGAVIYGCQRNYNSTCYFICGDGFFMEGNPTAKCSVSGDHVDWFYQVKCTEIEVCRPNPCKNHGLCSVLDDKTFACNCSNTGYKGRLCNTGIVGIQPIPKLSVNKISPLITVTAKPARELVIIMIGDGFTFTPSRINLDKETTFATFQVTSTNIGVREIRVVLAGESASQFEQPDYLHVLVSSPINSDDSIFSKLSLAQDELPSKGCNEMALTKDFHLDCSDQKSPMLHSTGKWLNIQNNDLINYIQTQGVTMLDINSMITPLSLQGVEIREKSIATTIVPNSGGDIVQTVTGRTKQSDCQNFELSLSNVSELMDSNVFLAETIRLFSQNTPGLFKLFLDSDNKAFSEMNTRSLVITSVGETSQLPGCSLVAGRLKKNGEGNDNDSNNQGKKMPPWIVYQPIASMFLNVEGGSTTLTPTKHMCLAFSPCENRFFLQMPSNQTKQTQELPFFKNMKLFGWEWKIASFEFVKEGSLKYQLSSSLVEYDAIFTGTLDLHLVSPDFLSLDAKFQGDFLHANNELRFEEVINRGFIVPIKMLMSAEMTLNLTLKVMGQYIPIIFPSMEVEGISKLGGGDPGLLCDNAQRIIINMHKKYDSFLNTKLSDIIKINTNSQQDFSVEIMLSIKGGEAIAVQDKNNIKIKVHLLKDAAEYFITLLNEIIAVAPNMTSFFPVWLDAAESAFNNTDEVNRLLDNAGWSNVTKLHDSLYSLHTSSDYIYRLLPTVKSKLMKSQNLHISKVNNFHNRLDQRVKYKLQLALPGLLRFNVQRRATEQHLSGVLMRSEGAACLNGRHCINNLNLEIRHVEAGETCSVNVPSKMKDVIPEHALYISGTSLASIPVGRFLTLAQGEKIHIFIDKNTDKRIMNATVKTNFLGISIQTVMVANSTALEFNLTGNAFGWLTMIAEVKASLDCNDWHCLDMSIQGYVPENSSFIGEIEQFTAAYLGNISLLALERLENAGNALNNSLKRLSHSQQAYTDKENAYLNSLNELNQASTRLEDRQNNYENKLTQFNASAIVVHFENISKQLENECSREECQPICLSKCVEGICYKNVTATTTHRVCTPENTNIEKIRYVPRQETRYYERPMYQRYTESTCKTHIAGTIIGAAARFFLPFPTNFAVGVLSSIFSTECYRTSTVRLVGSERVPYQHHFVKAEPYLQTVITMNCNKKSRQNIFVGTSAPYVCNISCSGTNGTCTKEIPDFSCLERSAYCSNKRSVLMHQLAVNLNSPEWLQLYNDLEDVRIQSEIAASQYKRKKIDLETASLEYQLAATQLDLNIHAFSVANYSYYRISNLVKTGLAVAEAQRNGNNMVSIKDVRFSKRTSTGHIDQLPLSLKVYGPSGTQIQVRILLDTKDRDLTIRKGSKRIAYGLYGDLESVGRQARKRRSVNSAETVIQTDDSSTMSELCQDSRQIGQFLYSIILLLADNLGSLKSSRESASEIINSIDESSKNISLKDMSTSSSDTNITLMNYKLIEENKRYLETVKQSYTVQFNDTFWEVTMDEWRSNIENMTNMINLNNCAGVLDCVLTSVERLYDLYEFVSTDKAKEMLNSLPVIKEFFSRLVANRTLNFEEILTLAESSMASMKYIIEDSIYCGDVPDVVIESDTDVFIQEDDVTLRCIGISDTNMTYKWMKNGKPIETVTSSSLMLVNTTKDDNGFYQCIVTNFIGEATSAAFRVAVQYRPIIILQPVHRSIIKSLENSTVLECNATGIPKSTIGWYFSHTHNITNSRLVNNENGNVLFLSNPQSGWYSCNAVNSYGKDQSKMAKLDVLDYSSLQPEIAVAFNLTGNVSFYLTTDKTHVVSNNTTNTTHHSRLERRSTDDTSYNQTDLTTNTTSHSPASENTTQSVNEDLENQIKSSLNQIINSSSLHVTNLELFSRGQNMTVQFRLQEEGRSLMEESSTTMNEISSHYAEGRMRLLNKATYIHKALESGNITASYRGNIFTGDSHSMGVQFITTRCPRGQGLHHNGFICVDCPSGSFDGGNGHCTLCPQGTYQDKVGQTECHYCPDPYTTQTQGAKDVFYCQFVPPISYSNLSVLNATNGDNVQLLCNVSGNPLPTIEWLYNGMAIKPSQRYRLNGHTLTILGVTRKDEGQYKCMANNLVGNISINVLLAQVFVFPAAKVSMLKDHAITEGENLIIVCNTTGWPKPATKWINIDNRMHFSGNILTINGIRTDDKGKSVTCEAENMLGKYQDEFKITDVFVPVILNMWANLEDDQNTHTGLPEALVQALQDKLKIKSVQIVNDKDSTREDKKMEVVIRLSQPFNVKALDEIRKNGVVLTWNRQQIHFHVESHSKEALNTDDQHDDKIIYYIVASLVALLLVGIAVVTWFCIRKRRMKQRRDKHMEGPKTAADQSFVNTVYDWAYGDTDNPNEPEYDDVSLHSYHTAKESGRDKRSDNLYDVIDDCLDKSQKTSSGTQSQIKLTDDVTGFCEA